MPRIPQYALSSRKLQTGGAYSIGRAPQLSQAAGGQLKPGAATVSDPGGRARPMTVDPPKEIAPVDPAMVTAFGRTMSEAILKYNDRMEDLEAENAFIRARQDSNNLKYGTGGEDRGINGLLGHDMVVSHAKARGDIGGVYQ